MSFSYWIKVYFEKYLFKKPIDQVLTFYVPSFFATEDILKWLDLEARDIQRLYESNTPLFIAFCYLWDSRNFEKLGITLTDTHIIDAEGEEIPISDPLEKFEYNGYRAIFIDGFLSLPHLTKMLRNYKERLYSGSTPQKLNDFYAFAADNDINFNLILPDVSIVQGLYNYFEVTSFEDLFMTVDEFKSIFTLVDYNSKISEVLTIDGDCHIVDLFPKPNVFFLDKLPQIMIKKIAKMHANKSNAQGDLQIVSKDVLQTITSGQIKGKDLVGLCISNSVVKNLCDKDNQAIFRRALKAEFNIDYPSPKDMYIEVYKKRGK